MMSNKYRSFLILLTMLFLIQKTHVLAANDGGSLTEYGAFLNKLDKSQVVSTDTAKKTILEFVFCWLAQC